MTAIRYKRCVAGCLSSFLLAAIPLDSSAQSWSGLGGDNLWSNPLNWVGGVAPPSANTTFVTFAPGAATFAPNADAAWTLNRLDISGPPPYALSGNTLTFDGTTPLVNVSGAGHSIANMLSFSVTALLTTPNDLTLSGDLGGAGGISKSGAGRLTFAGSTIYTGTTTINAGTLRLGNGATGPSGIFDIVNNAALEFEPLVGMTTDGTVTGTGSVTIISGTVAQVGGPLAHSGTTTILNGGALAASVTNNALLTIAAGGTMDTGGSTVGSLAGAGQLNINSGTFIVGGDNTSTTFTGALGGPGNFTKVGAGSLILGVSTVHTGTTTIAGGTLRIGDGVTSPGGFFDIVNNAALEFQPAGGMSTDGTVTGTGSVTIISGTVAQVGGPFAHAGTTTILNGGTLAASVTNNALLTIAAGGTHDTGGSIVGSLAGAGQLNINSGTFTVGGDNTSTAFSGVIASAGALVKNGTGSLTLSGINTYAGGTTINAGAIVVTGSMAGPVTVNNGGTLGGTGTATGSVTVNAGGTLSPGVATGQLNTGSLVLAGTLLQQIAGATLGTQYDNTNVTGTVNVAGATLTLAGAFVPGPGNNFTIITNDGVDAVTGTFAGLAEGASIPFNGRTLRISYIGGTGNDVVLTVSPLPGVAVIPIPTLSQWSLLILAVILLLAGGIAVRGRERR